MLGDMANQAKELGGEETNPFGYPVVNPESMNESLAVVLLEFDKKNQDGTTSTLKWTLRARLGEDEFILLARALNFIEHVESISDYRHRDKPERKYGGSGGGFKRAEPVDPIDDQFVASEWEHFTFNGQNGLGHGIRIYGTNGEEAAGFGRVVTDSGLFGNWMQSVEKVRQKLVAPNGRGGLNGQVVVFVKKNEPPRKGYQVTGFEA